MAVTMVGTSVVEAGAAGFWQAGDVAEFWRLVSSCRIPVNSWSTLVLSFELSLLASQLWWGITESSTLLRRASRIWASAALAFGSVPTNTALKALGGGGGFSPPAGALPPPPARPSPAARRLV